MDLLDRYRHFQIELFSLSENCSEGNQWVWNHVTQCLEETDHVIGFVLGCLAIALCVHFFISLSVVHVKRTNSTHSGGVKMSSAMNLLSEIAALFGAILSFQLPLQILYSTILIPVHFLCFVYICLSQSDTTNQKRFNGGKRKSKSNKCMYPFHLLLPTVFLITFATKTLSLTNSHRSYEFNSTHHNTSFPNIIPATWLPGYLLGSLAGLLFCCARMIEMVHLYRSLDSNRCMPAIYLTSILGGACYIYSVLSQNLSVLFIYHTLPWTLPRLITVGIDMGILIQRMLYKQRSRKRKLSSEDAKSLLSSDVEGGGDLDISDDDGSEEVLWMPLKIVEPYPSVSVSRVQIISESDMTIKEFDEDFEAEILHNLTEDVENDNSKENSIIAPEDSIRNTVEKADVLTDVICKNDVTNKTDMEIQSPERQRYTNGDIDSSGSSSSDTNDDTDHVTGNRIIKENIKTITEVSKEEKIVSWINSSK